MCEEKDLLSIYKERILNESKRGDQALAIKKADVSQPTYHAGIKKDKYAELTTKEVEVIETHIKILDDRKKEINKKVKQYAGK